MCVWRHVAYANMPRLLSCQDLPSYRSKAVLQAKVLQAIACQDYGQA